MTQFIELTTDSGKKPINYTCIESISPTASDTFVYTALKNLIVVKESPAEIMAKIKEAQANDPLERIADALESIENKLNILLKPTIAITGNTYGDTE